MLINVRRIKHSFRHFNFAKGYHCALLAIFTLLHFNATAAVNSDRVIEVNAIDWCPQICLDKEHPGYVVELVQEAFKHLDYQLNIQIYPWSRAIKNVTAGKADALLSPAKSEAPQLRYPRVPVGFQQMCFFNLADNPWNYQGASSLAGQQIGIANDTSIEELNDYVKSHPEQFQFQPYHERYLNQSLAKLEKGRMDSFLFTKNSTLFHLYSTKQINKFKVAGCVSKAPIYIAFSPIAAKQAQLTQIMAKLDIELSKLQRNGYVEKLMHKYHLTAN